MKISKRGLLIGSTAAILASGLGASGAMAEGTIKIGVILEYSGPFAVQAKEIDNGINLALEQRGDSIAGKKIEIIRKDTGGPKPDVAKRLATELVTRDKVDMLAGVVLTPNALAIADVATQAKVPFVIMNAATSIITAKSPYIVRFSFTLPQVSAPLAEWAFKNGIKEAYTLVSDYGPGLDAEASFKKAFTAAGGKIVGDVRVPLSNPDFAPYVQRVKDAKPQAVFVFVPAGAQAIGLMKAAAERELVKSGIQMIGTGDMTDDAVLQSMGDAALGLVTSHHYSYAHKSPHNKAFTDGVEAIDNSLRPDFMTVGGYDGMIAIYKVIEQLKGKMDGDKAMAIFKSMKFESPRGPIAIDPATRDIVQDVYIRRVEKVGDKLVNVEFDKIPSVKDPGK